MRGSVVAIALLFLCTTASAQVRVGRVEVRAEDTSCWSNSWAPCSDIGQAAIHVTTRARAARVRIVSVEARSYRQGSPWVATAGDFQLLVGRRQQAGPDVTLAARRSHAIQVFFRLIPIEGDAVIRTTLEVDGQRVTVEAPHSVVYEHPDPEF